MVESQAILLGRSLRSAYAKGVVSECLSLVEEMACGKFLLAEPWTVGFQIRQGAEFC